MLAVEQPEALARIEVDPLRRHRPGQGRPRSSRAAGFPDELVAKVAPVHPASSTTSSRARTRRWSRSTRSCSPTDGDIVALDGKVTLDANADFRHPTHAELEDAAAADPLEAKAKATHLNYVKLDGKVGIIGNGAGLVMSTLDVVAYAGEKHGGVKPANFLDIGGGASAEVMAAGLDVILGDKQVKSVFVNVFGGITACDAVANGHRRGAGDARRRRQQAAGRAARRQQRRRGPPHPGRGQPSAGHRRRRPWTRRRQGRRARERSEGTR